MSAATAFVGRVSIRLSLNAHVLPRAHTRLRVRDALAPVLREMHRKSPFVTVCFVDSGYNGDEAQRAAFEASRISVAVVQRNDKRIKGFVVLRE